MERTAKMKFDANAVKDEIFNSIKQWYCCIRKCAKDIELKDIADELGVCEKTLNRWLSRKTMPSALQARMLRDLAQRYNHHGSGDAA